MKKIISLLLIVLLLGGCSSNKTPISQTIVINTPMATNTPTVTKNPNAIFRNVVWGMTKQEVINTESMSILAQDDKSLLYETYIDNNKCVLNYYFNEKNKMYTIGVIFKENHSNDNDYIADYQSVNKVLKEKYGEPEFDETDWKNDLYKNNPQKFGFAVSVGHLVYISNWKLKDTKITSLLRGDNYKILHTITYVSENITAPKKDSGL